MKVPGNIPVNEQMPNTVEIIVQNSNNIDSIKETVDQLNKPNFTKSRKNLKRQVGSGNKKLCSYRVLQTQTMDDIYDLEKPEFILHPERYFLDRMETERFTKMDEEETSKLSDDLKLRHDEKSIFPKYILDMDLKMRTAPRDSDILACMF